MFIGKGLVIKNGVADREPLLAVRVYLRLHLDAGPQREQKGNTYQKGNRSMRVLNLEKRMNLSIPMMAAQVPAGFPSPAEDYEDKPLDFNELLVKNPAATFAVKAQGDSMVGAGIHDGDICVVDRSMKPVDGSVIVALVNGEFTMKRLRMKAGRVWLHPENAGYPDIPITEGTEFEIWGVIGKSVRMHLP